MDYIKIIITILTIAGVGGSLIIFIPEWMKTKSQSKKQQIPSSTYIVDYLDHTGVIQMKEARRF